MASRRLLNLGAGLDPATGGTVYVDGVRFTGRALIVASCFRSSRCSRGSPSIGNIEFGLQSKGVPSAERAQDRQRYVKLVGLAGFETYHPYRLSGGMRQRVGIARALAIDPSVLLMDEPFGALDAQTRESMQKALARDLGGDPKTVLFITHDIREAVYLSDRVLVHERAALADVSLDLEIDLPRPRNRHDSKFQEYELQLERAISPSAS